MLWFEHIKQVKIVLVVIAVIIAVASLVVSHYLIKDLAREEQNKMSVWAEAMRSLSKADENTDLNLVLQVINGNNTIPVIVLDAQDHVITYRNIELDKDRPDSIALLVTEAIRMRKAGDAIKIHLTPTGKQIKSGDDYIEICYEESIMLRRLSTYPYVQLGVVLIFVVIAIFALLSSKKAEQNKVWVGLSKETAHQLGTPISSLMAWVEILKENYPHDELLLDLDKDVKRLELIAERFSKIGSLPELKSEQLDKTIEHVVDYISRRSSDKVQIIRQFPEYPIMVSINAALFEWVIENLCKNAIDAMEGKGIIRLKIIDSSPCVAIEISDTGKGIEKQYYKSVFTPGYTTKRRGWGLGLSLAKRIIEAYHKGHIFVKSSEIGKGTIFRIELKK
ncbi:MAG: HAMP domain-containing sensor histidine kinase [Bacteroidaceae bacterium]